MSDFTSMEIDFMPVTSQTGEGTTKSGDAILARFLDPLGRQKVVLVDAGFQGTGEQVLEHLDTYYDTDVVDVAISTHPDADHLNGIQVVVDRGRVGELCIHRPRLHTARSLSEFTNLEAQLALDGQRHEVLSGPPRAIDYASGARPSVGGRRAGWDRAALACRLIRSYVPTAGVPGSGGHHRARQVIHWA